MLTTSISLKFRGITNGKNLMLPAIILSSMIWISSCASLAAPSPPQWQDRKWEFDPDSPSLYYQYEVCTRKFLGICTKTEIKRDTIDLSDPAWRLKIHEQRFIAVMRLNPTAQ